jgi:metal-sulfur cluster biosynthetic enzyme
MSELEIDVVREALQQVIDPEVGLDVWTMGLVYAVRTDGDVLEITMTLTTRGCPMGGFITSEVKAALEALDGVREARIELVWDPPWSPDMIDHTGLEQLRGAR